LTNQSIDIEPYVIIFTNTANAQLKMRLFAVASIDATDIDDPVGASWSGGAN
jgi:hypothetical protein